MIKIKDNTFKISKKFMLAYVATIIIFVVYSIWYIFSVKDGNYNVCNIIIFGIASFYVLLGIQSMNDLGITISNVFQVIFFAALAVNCFNISLLQKEKTLKDIYFFLFGPTLFVILLRQKFIGLKISKWPRFHFSIDLVAIMIIIIYCLGQIYIFSITGVRFFSQDWLSIRSSKYIIPGISGLVASLKWISLMLLPDVKRFWIKLLIVLGTLSGSLLTAKRGDGMRIIIFLFMYVLYKYKNKIFNFRYLKNVAGFLLAIIIIFVLWGNYRQQQRGWLKEETQSSLMESIVDNEYLCWIYGYSAINFDVLKQIYIDEEYLEEFNEILRPIIRIVGGNSAIAELDKRTATKGLHGYNAGTFLAGFVKEIGWFYFIDVVILAFIILVFDKVFLDNSLLGGHIFLLMLTAISLFGNYYLEVNFFFSMILYLMLGLFICDVNKNKKRIKICRKRIRLYGVDRRYV